MNNSDLTYSPSLNIKQAKDLYNNVKSFDIDTFLPVLHVKLDVAVHSECRLLSIFKS